MANQQEVMMPFLMAKLGHVYMKKAGPLNRLIFVSNLDGKLAVFSPVVNTTL